MDVKPGDFFIGVVDFFAILIPGAAVAYALTPWEEIFFGTGKIFPFLNDPPARWIAFVLGAYVLGHLVASVSGAVLDPIYRRTYRNMRRLPEVRRKDHVMDRLRAAWTLKEAEAADSMLSAAREIREKQMGELSLDAGPVAIAEHNIHNWAQSAVTLGSSPAAGEIERFQASSKFFRSMTLVLFALLCVGVFGGAACGTAPRSQSSGWSPVEIVLGILLLVAFGHRFMHLRWEATERTYEYYLLLAIQSKRQALEKGE